MPEQVKKKDCGGFLGKLLLTVFTVGLNWVVAYIRSHNRRQPSTSSPKQNGKKEDGK